ncbi:MAG: TIGR01777 family protein [Actinobacteria bacterium]|nr:TIGR01777 family protein [Actinomycetota bacterium]
MRVAITGAHGLVGRRLGQDLAHDGHQVIRITRRPAEPDDVVWDPATGSLEGARIDGVDAIVHLAGETVGQRWTASTRRRILDSRVEGTGTIAKVASQLSRPPSVLVCASAVGYYGDRGDELLTDDSDGGRGFLAEVVTAWEAAAEPARAAGIRVVHMRKGIVLSRDGGALRRLLLPFRLGLGGRVGSGRQWWPWLTLDDAVAAYRFALTSATDGPVNVVAGSTRNADFARALGKALRRPAAMPLPAPVVRLAMGEMGREMLLASQRVESTRLAAEGFAFGSTTIDRALAHVLRAG